MIYRFGQYEVDAQRFLLCKNHQPLRIEPKVFELLVCLLRHHGELVSKATLISEVWQGTHVSDWALTRCIREIRRVLNEDEGSSCIKTVYGRGYQFAADVEMLSADEQSTEASITPSPASLIHRGSLNSPRFWMVLMFGAITSIAATWFYIKHNSGMVATTTPGSVMVLPFALRSRDPGNDYIADGMTDEVIAKLAHVPGLKVISRTSSMHYKNSSKRATEIAAEVRVSHLVEAELAVENNRISTVVKLIAADNDQLLWSKTYQEMADAIQLLPDLITHDIKKALLREYALAHQASIATTRSNDAYHLYLRGRYHWNLRTGVDIAKALTLLEQATMFDPNYAQAWAGLADLHVQLANYGNIPSIELPKARDSVNKALQLNPQLAEAWAALGQLELNQYYNWNKAEQAYQKAISFTPGYAAPRQWYAELLSILGRHDEALAMIASAAELDPYSPLITAVWGLCLNAAGDYPNAIIKLQRALAMDSAFTWVNRELAFAHLQQGAVKQALAARRQQMLTEGVAANFMAEFDLVTDRGGMLAFWRWYVDELNRRAQRSWVSPTLLAEAYTGARDFDNAMIWLERAAEQKGEYLPHMLSRSSEFPRLNRLPRYRQLLTELGLNHLTQISLPTTAGAR